jgi:F-type H+-transporting ATPase subunit c
MKAKMLLLIAAFLFLATPIFAQTQGGDKKWVAITSGFSMAIASAVCGLAQAKAVAAAAEGMARNPAASAAIRFARLLGLIFIESLVLYTLAIVFLKVV